MIIEKFLNNNMLLVNDNHEEMIVMGKGLRFHYKVGDEIKDEDIEKTYVLQDSTNKNGYLQVLENAPDIYLEIVHHIIEMAQLKISSPFNKQIFVTLLDHLLYAVERYEKGIALQNRMLWEIQKFYPNEFMLGLQAVDYINETLNVKLPEAEAGNIAFHFVNAQIKSNDLSTENGMLMVKMLKDIFQIIQLHYGYTIDENSLNYSRFVVHMQFFLQRLLENKMLENVCYKKISIKIPARIHLDVMNIKKMNEGKVGGGGIGIAIRRNVCMSVEVEKTGQDIIESIKPKLVRFYLNLIRQHLNMDTRFHIIFKPSNELKTHSGMGSNALIQMGVIYSINNLLNCPLNDTQMLELLNENYYEEDNGILTNKVFCSGVAHNTMLYGGVCFVSEDGKMIYHSIYSCW